MKKIKLPKSRNEIKNFQPYIAGKSITEIKKQFNIKEVYKLASNENPLGCSKKIKKILNNLYNEFHRYPETTSKILREAISKKLNIQEEEIIIGSGTDELIELVAKTYLSKKDNVVISKYAFIRYKMAAQLMGSKILETEMNNFKHDLINMAKKVNKNTKIVFIANPNNPTGTYNNKLELKKFLTYIIYKKLNPIVVIDEAYYEYAKVYKDYPESLNFRNIYHNLLILRTFSKIYGLAGLRIGFGISRREIIEELNKVRPPFNVSIVSQYVAKEALNDQNHIIRSISLVLKEKEFLYKQLDKLKLKYILSAANFILIDVTPYKGKDIFEYLLREGIIIRSMEEYNLDNFIRLTIGTHKENVLFLKHLKNFLKKEGY